MNLHVILIRASPHLLNLEIIYVFNNFFFLKVVNKINRRKLIRSRKLSIFKKIELFKILSTIGKDGTQKRLYKFNKCIRDIGIYTNHKAGINPKRKVAYGKNGYRYLS